MIVFVSNFFNHHQQPLAEQMFKLSNGKYRFIELEPMPNSFKKSGYTQYEKSPILVSAWKDKKQTEDLILNAEVVLFGNIKDFSLIKKRLKNGKLTFSVGERCLKKGMINLLSPKLLRFQWLYHVNFYNKPLYKLCASAYAAKDLYCMRSFKNKCFKWGYFTEIPNIDVDNILEDRRANSTLKIMSIARFLSWKRLDLSIRCVKNLIEKGYNIELNIYGSGSELENLSNLIDKLGVNHCITLKGILSNRDLLQEIRKHSIFLFTSDRHEGWGAVVNEAMANACPVVGSDAAGSVPFLIKNWENGVIFRSGDLNDLTDKVEMLIADQYLREKLSHNAYLTMREIWSPENAAVRLLYLIESLQKGQKANFEIDGPCSFIG